MYDSICFANCFARNSMRKSTLRKIVRRFEQIVKFFASQNMRRFTLRKYAFLFDLLFYGDSTRGTRGRSQLQKWQWAKSMARSIFLNMLMHYWWVGLVGIEFLFVLRWFSFEWRFSLLTKLCMSKCRHLRVRVRALRAAVMRRREALALLPPSVATISSGPSSFASRNAGSARGRG
jgi:hypothetical protein